MAFRELDDVPRWANRALIGLILLYFAVFLYGESTGDRTGQLVANALFGVVAIWFAGVLAVSVDEPVSALGGAAACLGLAGLLQLGALASGSPSLDALSGLFAIVGILLYLVVVWRRDRATP